MRQLGEVGTLCGPEWGGPQPQDYSGGDEGVEAGVELCSYVGGVAEYAHHQCPFNLHHDVKLKYDQKENKKR